VSPETLLLVEMGITAVIFTLFGKYSERHARQGDTAKVIEATIDRLIKDEYIQVKRDKNGEVELLKYYEE
jgi:hypothetical protein|tara:strand:- start:398 stop:607 length:210 start_codon:yes stop_codon:yes gene_type:complete